MSIAVKNIIERIQTFADCLNPFDDTAVRYRVETDVICSNCGDVAKNIYFHGKTPFTSDRFSSSAHLCLGCARAFQHCLRRKNLLQHITCFFHCFQRGYVGTATTGLHVDYKDISPPTRIKCYNCGCCCKDEYYHGRLAEKEFTAPIYQLDRNGQVFRVSFCPFNFADICFGCCRAFFVAQAYLFSSDSMAFAFDQMRMNPHKCLTRTDFQTHFFESIWMSMQFKEYMAEQTIAKPIQTQQKGKNILRINTN